MQTRHRDRPIYSTAELRASYNSLYESVELEQLTSYYLWAFSLISPSPGAKLLDISCGKGALVRIARQKGLLAYGIDLSDVAVRITNIRLGTTLAVIADGEALPFPNGVFEFVFNLGSIEHYLHPERGVSEIARVLSPTGHACILLPNSYSLLENIWRVFLTGDVGDQGQPVERYATRLQWQRMLTQNGLEIYKIARYNLPFPRNLQDWWWYIKHPRKLLWLLVSFLVPFNLSGCFAFLCRPQKKVLL